MLRHSLKRTFGLIGRTEQHFALACERSVAPCFPTLLTTWIDQPKLCAASDEQKWKSHPVPLALSLSVSTKNDDPKRLRAWLKSLFRTLWRHLRAFIRLTELVAVATPYLITYPIIQRVRFNYGSLYEAWWRSVLRTLNHLGPAVIKFLQWASSRRDLFDAELCDRLSELHDRVTHHSWHETDKALLKALGEGWEQRLQLSQAPIGSGCVGQMYKGRLEMEDGERREVAVKVIHPRTKEKIEMDLNLLDALAKLVERVPSLRYWSIRDALTEFSGLISVQLDMEREAENLRRLRKNFANDRRVEFPEPYIASPDVLIEEYMAGKPVSYYINQTSSDWTKVKSQLAATSMSAFLQMCLRDNWIHADLHPGNVLVEDQPSGPVIQFIDAGICCALTPASHKAFLRIFYEAVRGNGRAVAQAVLQSAPEQACEDVESFVTEIAQIVDNLLAGAYDKNAARDPYGMSQGHTETVRDARLQANSAAVGSIFRTCRKYKVKLDGSLSTVIVSTFILEGLSRSLDPHVNLFRQALPYLTKILGAIAA